MSVYTSLLEGRRLSRIGLADFVLLPQERMLSPADAAAALLALPERAVLFDYVAAAHRIGGSPAGTLLVCAAVSATVESCKLPPPRQAAALFLLARCFHDKIDSCLADDQHSLHPFLPLLLRQYRISSLAGSLDAESHALQRWLATLLISTAEDIDAMVSACPVLLDSHSHARV